MTSANHLISVCLHICLSVSVYVCLGLTTYLSNSMEKSFSQEIPNTSWNLRTHYSVHSSLPCLPTLSQMNPVYPPTYFLKIHFNTILSSIPTLPKQSLSFWCPPQNPVSIALFLQTRHIPHPTPVSLSSI